MIVLWFESQFKHFINHLQYTMLCVGSLQAGEGEIEVQKLQFTVQVSPAAVLGS